MGGPSEIFELCEKQFMDTNNYLDFRIFLATQLQLFRNGVKVCLDHDMFSCSPTKIPTSEYSNNTFLANNVLQITINE